MLGCMEANPEVPTDFAFKTTPFSHQLKEFEFSRELESRAYWWEPGCAKTKPALDTAAYLYLHGKITGMLVLAPNGVHTNWYKDEMPAHMPENVMRRTKTFLWQTQKRHSKKYKEAFAQFLAHDGLCILFASYDSFMTDDSAKIIRKFMQDRRCLYVLDEADKIKSPNAGTTKRVQASSVYAPYRRVLSGTPVDNSPFDVYSQVKFLDRNAWTHLGITDFGAFKQFFGVYAMISYGDGPMHPELTAYRNLDILKQVVLSVGSRYLKTDVLDLPEKLYKKRYFTLTPKQRKFYDAVEQDYVAYFADGSSVTADMALVRMGRLMQVTSGYIPADDEDDLRPIDDVNPRLVALREEMEERRDQKTIIWARYNIDIDMIVQTLRKDYKLVVYDGRTKPDARYQAKVDFQNGDAQLFIGKPSACGRGLTLHAAKGAIYYNRGFRWMEAQQSEDRCHRAGMSEDRPLYSDLLAEDTKDEYVIDKLREKRENSATVMGDSLPPWIP